MEVQKNPNLIQLFVRLLDGKTAALTFSGPQAYGHQIKQRMYDLTMIPTRVQRLICGGYQIEDGAAISLPGATINLVLRLRGGKGGFGSLLRGAATKAGQKKTNNFDACRDMSGRRLRHVNAEKSLEEWKAEEKERKLEKLAEEFLKKQAKKGKQGVGNGEAQKYVEKYREESARCVEAVDLAVREALQNGKRKAKLMKAEAGSAQAKRMKIWKGKIIMGDSDSEDSSDDENDEENEKSVVLNNTSQVASSKDTEGSSGSITGGGQNGESSRGGASCESGSEEEKGNSEHQSLVSNGFSDAENNISEEDNGCVKPEINKEKAAPCAAFDVDGLATGGSESKKTENEDLSGPGSENLQEINCQPSNTSNFGNGEDVNGETNDSGIKGGVNGETDAANAKSNEPEKPINFDDFNSAADLEVLGMERLKSELQSRGLKCGGTLQERTARLFLLKSTTLDKIPKKLLAKK